MLLSFAEAGATVVRLKGGDPLVCTIQQKTVENIHGIVPLDVHYKDVET